MNWISNVEKCNDEKDAIQKLEEQKNNVMYSKYVEFEVDKNNLICGEDKVFYFDVLFPIITSDIISNIRSDNYMDVIIDGQIVTDIDFILIVISPMSEFKCRFYKYDEECTAVCTIYMDCIILTNENKKNLNTNSIIETSCFYYKDGKCFPRNIKIMYFCN